MRRTAQGPPAKTRDRNPEFKASTSTISAGLYPLSETMPVEKEIAVI